MKALGVDVNPYRYNALIVDEGGKILERVDEDQQGAVQDIGALGIADEPERDTGWTAASGSKLEPVVSRPGIAAITAEAWVGAAKGARHAVCLWIGERVFAGILLNGEPWSGARDLAGSAAYLALNPVERQDYRKFGSLAAEVSHKGIARRLAWRIQAGDHSAVLERAGDLDAITATHVFDGARAGDGVAISVVRDTAKYIGMAVANLAAAIDPEVVVLAGPIASAGDLIVDAVRQECSRRLPPAMAEGFRCEISPLIADGVAVGAARIAMLASGQ